MIRTFRERHLAAKGQFDHLGRFARETWRLAAPFWRSSEKTIAAVLLASITSFNLAMVFIMVKINRWYADFYQSLELRDFEAFKGHLLVFAGWAAFYILLAVYQLYLNLMLQIRWRRWLTDHYLDRWFSERVYYRMEVVPGKTDNPDQRIAQDIHAFTSNTLEYCFGFLNAFVTLVSFAGILWGLSGILRAPFIFWAGTFEIHGYMVWCAVFYALVGSWLTHKIGKKLVPINFNLEKYQADFRFNLVRIRENAESVALYQGEETEKISLMERFKKIWTTWWEMMVCQKYLMSFTATYNQIAIIFPILVASPRFFSGAIHLGILMQISSAFGQVQSALSWFINAYPGLANWKASVDRLLYFEEDVQAKKRELLEVKRLEVIQHQESWVEGRFEKIWLPNGRTLFEDLDIKFQPRRHVLITGPSGSGKSTFFRALSGIWPYASGEVIMPEAGGVLFLPQKPYLPVATLEAVLTYPKSEESVDRGRLESLLDQVYLPRLKGQWQEVRHWSQALSVGEQARLGIARALLHGPRWLFMDESTASVDEAMEQSLYEIIGKTLPETTVVSIAHHASVTRFFDFHLRFEPDSEISKWSYGPLEKS